MGKKRRHNRRHDAVTNTSHQNTANAQVAHAIQKILARPPLTQIEDRRTHHPDGRLRPAKKINGTRLSPHKIKITKKIVQRRAGTAVHKTKTVRIRTIPTRIKFAAPKKVMICVRRKVRREVLLAFGRGGGRHKNPKRNRYSEVSC